MKRVPRGKEINQLGAGVGPNVNVSASMRTKVEIRYLKGGE